MPTQILMPALSPTMEEGTLAKWLVKEGDTVAAGDLLAEIETDKAVMEFEATDEGTIGKLLVSEGTEAVKVNTPIAVLLEEGESAADIDDTAAPADRQTEKANAADGGQKAQGADAAAKAAPAPGGGPAKAAPPAPQDDVDQRIFASPLARRIATERGIDLTALSGSGPHGRIIRADVEAARPGATTGQPSRDGDPERPAAPAATAMPTGATADAVRKIYEGREFEEISLDGMRRIVAARLTEAKQTIPHFYLRRQVLLDDLLEFRAQLNAKLESRAIKLSVNDFIIKACAVALQTVPDANAIWAGDRILRLKPSDVAVAVAVDGGLFTPVIRDADTKTLSVISKQMKDLATRARNRKLAPQEYQGGSFAVSNLGMYGIDSFDAVINPPHGAILAVGAGKRQPVVGKDDRMMVATVVNLTLSVDHRVIDGALGAQLLEEIVQNLENPTLLLV